MGFAYFLITPTGNCNSHNKVKHYSPKDLLSSFIFNISYPYPSEKIISNENGAIEIA